MMSDQPNAHRKMCMKKEWLAGKCRLDQAKQEYETKSLDGCQSFDPVATL
jgi:hypothetical protein